jgi:hypothetical protein
MAEDEYDFGGGIRVEYACKGGGMNLDPTSQRAVVFCGDRKVQVGALGNGLPDLSSLAVEDRKLLGDIGAIVSQQQVRQVENFTFFCFLNEILHPASARAVA